MDRYVMGIDIETGGPKLGYNPLLAVGLCIYKIDNMGMKLLAEIEVHFEGDIEKYDRKTIQFWKENPEAWEHVKSDCVSEEEGALKLIDFVKKWQKLAIDKKVDFYTITDNCWFDDTWISHLFSKYGGYPLRHNYYSGYTRLSQVVDINQLMSGARMCGIKIPKFEYENIHDHTPVNDAKKIVEKYYNFICYTKKIQKYKS